MNRVPDVVVLDVDGTLVDSVYHHVSCWDEAFRLVDVRVPGWRIHRAIGMGGDRLVTAVAGEEVEDRLGDRIREHHDRLYTEAFRDVRALPGAGELITTLKERGRTVAVVSSGSAEQTAAALELVGAEAAPDLVLTGEDVDRTKPDSEPLDEAVRRCGGGHAAAVGDSVWDMIAARKRGDLAIGLRCGGFAAAELVEAGAALVFDDPEQLVDQLAETPLSP